MSLLQLLKDFNISFLIIIIFIISSLFLISFILIIERLLFFRRIYINEKKRYKELIKALSNKDTFFIFNLCNKVFSPLVNLIKAGLNQRNYSVFHIKEAINQATTLELPRFEKNLTIIGVLTTIIPFIGLIVLFISNIDMFFSLKSNHVNFLDLIFFKKVRIVIIFIYVLFFLFIITFLYHYIIKKKNDIIFIFEKWAGKLVISLINKRE